MNNILMNTEMTKAILDGCKVQTRRAIPSQKEDCDLLDNYFLKDRSDDNYSLQKFIQCVAKYKKDEVIWVREPVTVWALTDNITLDFSYKSDGVSMSKALPSRFYDKDNNTPKWTDGHENGRGIPNGCIREMARIFLKITNVRVERLQDMVVEDYESEGLPLKIEVHKDIVDWWKTLWNKTAQKGYKWDDNPYVFVYEFERVEK